MELTGVGIITAIVFGFVAVIKALGINKKFAPVFAVVFGLIFTFMAYFIKDIGLLNAILGGIIIGLSAVGLWSGPKNVLEGLKGEIN